MTAQRILSELRSLADPQKAVILQRFFKTGPGDYGAGDRFMGITVPKQRLLAKKYCTQVTLSHIATLLKSPWHEARLTALFLLIHHFDRARAQLDSTAQQAVVDLYLNHLDRVNNWDLVDSSAHKILGPYLENRPRKLLFDLAHSDHLWRQRVAVIATLHFIRHNDYRTTLELAELLLHHPHDLMHKAVGWMLREVGKCSAAPALNFLTQHAPQMPRTMLRYALEKYTPEIRAHFMQQKA